MPHVQWEEEELRLITSMELKPRESAFKNRKKVEPQDKSLFP